MEIVPLKTVHGEDKVWSIIGELDPRTVCRNAGVTFESEQQIYTVTSFGIDFKAGVRDRQITTDSSLGPLFLNKYKDFFRLSMLWYLTSAKDIPQTGRLVKPIDVKGGQRFFTGTHLLPLERLAEKYGSSKELFMNQGMTFGAEKLNHGDAAIRLYPLPRVPITMILWLEDDEFPPRVDLLFDSTIDMQIVLSDIVWSIATLTALVMLQ